MADPTDNNAPDDDDDDDPTPEAGTPEAGAPATGTTTAAPTTTPAADPPPTDDATAAALADPATDDDEKEADDAAAKAGAPAAGTTTAAPTTTTRPRATRDGSFKGLGWLLGMIGVGAISRQTQAGATGEFNSFFSEDASDSWIEDLAQIGAEDEMKPLAIKVVDMILGYPSIRGILLHPSVPLDWIAKFLRLVIKQAQRKSARRAARLERVADEFIQEATQYLEDIREGRVAPAALAAGATARITRAAEEPPPPTKRTMPAMDIVMRHPLIVARLARLPAEEQDKASAWLLKHLNRDSDGQLLGEPMPPNPPLIDAVIGAPDKRNDLGDELEGIVEHLFDDTPTGVQEVWMELNGRVKSAAQIKLLLRPERNDASVTPVTFRRRLLMLEPLDGMGNDEFRRRMRLVEDAKEQGPVAATISSVIHALKGAAKIVPTGVSASAGKLADGLNGWLDAIFGPQQRDPNDGGIIRFIKALFGLAFLPAQIIATLVRRGKWTIAISTLIGVVLLLALWPIGAWLTDAGHPILGRLCIGIGTVAGVYAGVVLAATGFVVVTWILGAIAPINWLASIFRVGVREIRQKLGVAENVEGEGEEPFINGIGRKIAGAYRSLFLIPLSIATGGLVQMAFPGMGTYVIVIFVTVGCCVTIGWLHYVGWRPRYFSQVITVFDIGFMILATMVLVLEQVAPTYVAALTQGIRVEQQMAVFLLWLFDGAPGQNPAGLLATILAVTPIILILGILGTFFGYKALRPSEEVTERELKEEAEKAEEEGRAPRQLAPPGMSRKGAMIALATIFGVVAVCVLLASVRGFRTEIVTDRVSLMPINKPAASAVAQPAPVAPSAPAPVVVPIQPPAAPFAPSAPVSSIDDPDTARLRAMLNARHRDGL